ncbi:MAG: hypothetical protein Q4P18_08015 [Methanobrevibacter sp.]|uniref:SLAC1 family transporter n=1 Tax=Methanobrevibacter sp. TaxID=66852 RepID=UPI0026DEC6A2|nr:hypothetical protein [Methanobrevibacter sp.]MDO5849466.1 hypothetical protein [Methanobrevibacter sp.]
MNLARAKLIPLPICGIILSFFGLGMFFKDITPLGFGIFTSVGLLLIAMLFLKVFLFRKETLKDLESPIILGTSGTLPMAVMMLAVFLKDFSFELGLAVWFLAFLVHVVLIAYFTKEHILNFEMELVYTNYFVVFIGIGMGAITGAGFNLDVLVDGIFIFSFVSMVVLLVLVSYRYFKVPIEDHTFKPLVCIYAAPFSLILCAFIQTTLTKSMDFIIALYILSIVFYIFGLIKAMEYIRLPFFPTFAAFTFPFVISATATKQVNNLVNVDLGILLLVQIAIAIAIVAYVLAQYIYFIITAPYS